MNEIVKHTKETFLKRYSAESIKIELSKINSIELAMKSDNNSIAFYRREIGVQLILASIEAQLFLLKKSVNVHQNLNEFQIEEIAREINQKYYFLNLNEIAFIFNQAKRGVYGVIQYALDMPLIFSWFDKYVDERIKISIEQQKNEHDKIKNGSTVKDGKLYKTENLAFNDLQLELLSKFKETLIKKDEFNQKEFEEFKKNYNNKNKKI